MSYETETLQTSAQVLNENFVNLIEQGHTKRAEEAGTPLVREIVRQDASVRKVFTVKPIVGSDLDLHPDTDQPMKFMDIEPRSVATYTQFYGTPKARFYTMRRVPVFFGRNHSDEFIKDKFELMSYRTDVRKLLADNSTKDIADQEDLFWRKTMLAAVNRNPAVQRTELARITPTGWVQGMRALYDRRKFVGKALMAKSRYIDCIDIPATTLGSDIARKFFEEGMENVEKLWGLPVITTIKSDIYLPDEAWMLAPENYLGKFWELQAPTLFVEQRANIIKFFVYECVGIGLGLTEGIQQLVFDSRRS